MNVRNCKKCGKLFNYAMGPIVCPQCREALEEKFKEVKTYIEQNPHSGIHDVAEACEVEVAQIQQWLREERLEFTSDSMVQLVCETCGAQIRTGRFCDKCKNEMANGFQRAIQPQKAPEPQVKKDPRDSARMRFLG
ncbi:MAG: flagellar protein [Lachnospiraceae bacterium]|nr:flagellar protein [Lachnospiraceae bacterium]